MDYQSILYAIKYMLTAFVAILIPAYWSSYGVQNFLWLSDIGIFLTLGAVWLESSLLISIVFVGIFPGEFIWNIDFFVHLFTGYSVFGISDYMFETKQSLFLKILSLFHIVMPILWVYLLLKWGYDPQACWYAILMVWSALIATYVFTDPEKNVNEVFAPRIHNWLAVPSLVWLLFLLCITLVTILCMHGLCKWLF